MTYTKIVLGLYLTVYHNTFHDVSQQISSYNVKNVIFVLLIFNPSTLLTLIASTCLLVIIINIITPIFNTF